MELKICDIPPTICLNMIVKNESHIIKNTLENLCNKIKFSYWVICDTGSTDNTREIISDFFINKDIPGELHNHEWKNFAHNRTIALNEAFNKTDLLFIFDADDELHGNITMPKIVDNDGYLLNFGFSDGISYQRILLVNNKI
jgi:glycosyltransferase involved in cell wall biosynthesis